MIHVCTNCGYSFPSELSSLIEQNIQVYCERCGSPFNLKGVKFKPAPTPVLRKISKTIALSEKDSSNLNKLIQFLNKISFLPVFIFTVISFGLIFEVVFFSDWGVIIDLLFKRIFQGSIGLSILIYETGYIAPKVKEQKYNKVILDSLCWGILGCILYGIGVIILIKGIFIIFYVYTNKENRQLKAYDYGLLVKNSLNYLSAKAGFVIILMGIYGAYLSGIYLPSANSVIITFPYYIEIPIILIIYSSLLVIAIVGLSIDSKLKNEIRIKQKFDLRDSLMTILVGVMGMIFFAAGIFIFLKGVLLFFLYLAKPSGKLKKLVSYLEKKSPFSPQTYREPELTKKIMDKKKEPPESVSLPIPVIPTTREEVTSLKQEKPLEKELNVVKEGGKLRTERDDAKKEFKLKLHESLLPVKSEKDKKLIKEYFSKIFALLSKDLRQQIIDLKISKKEKRELLEELAFLSEADQVKYIESLVDLYRKLPKKLIEKIRKLPNVKPKHYDKIVEQLKYMDSEEQINFVQFLEENA